jgi:subtilisin-like proprotein convertase family protein
MMDAQLRETQEILLSQTGTVGQGSTVEAGNFTVNTTGTLSCYLYWPGSVLDIQLIDPDGNEIKDGYSGYKIDNSSIPTKVTVENAKQGTWKMSVYGREVSMNEEPFYAATAIEQRQATTANMPSGGSSNDSSAVLLLLVSLLCIGGVFGVYALSMRRR